MVLLSFSDSKHVQLILDGRKAQTTRKPRKTPIKVGDVLQVYFKSRMKKTCENCIFRRCNYSVQNRNYCFKDESCAQHTNLFGTAKVIKSEPFSPLNLCPTALEEWAKADGFESFEAADKWFTNVHGKDWVYLPWVLIFFEGDWLQDDAAIMAEIEYEQQQTEAEAMYEAEMQAQAEAEAEAEAQAEYEASQCYYDGGY